MSRKYYVMSGFGLRDNGILYTEHKGNIYGALLRYKDLFWVSLRDGTDFSGLSELSEEELALYVIQNEINVEFKDEM